MTEPAGGDMSSSALEMIFARLDRMEGRFDKRFDAVDKRFDAVERRIEGLEGRLGAVETDMRQGFLAVEHQIVRQAEAIHQVSHLMAAASSDNSRLATEFARHVNDCAHREKPAA